MSDLAAEVQSCPGCQTGPPPATGAALASRASTLVGTGAKYYSGARLVIRR